MANAYRRGWARATGWCISAQPLRVHSDCQWVSLRSPDVGQAVFPPRRPKPRKYANAGRSPHFDSGTGSLSTTATAYGWRSNLKRQTIPMTMAHDLMLAPLLSWRDARHRPATTTLPGILSRMASGELADFQHARAHQFHPWSMFLTQLAVIALRRANLTDPRLSEDEWRQLLLGLSGGAHQPWSVVVDDLWKPAFMQAPVPEGSVTDWQVHEHPDDLDVLVTAKNHDVKQSIIAGSDIEAWILALATLQTMQGYPGRGYHGISRMKGGYGSRPRVGTAADPTVSTRFLRDVDVMLSSWDALVERGFGDSGTALAWLAPWDGVESLRMSELSPHFIEICWRLRCVRHRDGLVARYTTTQNRRCLPEIENGDTGDPWIPIERDQGALTVGSGGFHYTLLSRVLFDFEPAAAQELRPC